MHPQVVLRRRNDTMDDEYSLMRKWMPRGHKEHLYDSYIDFKHAPQAVATSHAKKRMQQRMNVTGCVKGVYVPGTSHTVVATVVPCRAADSATIRRVRTIQDKKRERKKSNKLYANAKTAAQSATCAAAHARLNSYINAAASTAGADDKLRDEIAEARRRLAAVSNPAKVRKWNKTIRLLEAMA